MYEIANFLKTIFYKLDLLLHIENPYKYKYNIIFVLGDFSCDLDSFLSTICFAYFQNLKNNTVLATKSNEINYCINQTNNNYLYIPIINCKKDEFLWRFEIIELLNKINISPDELYFYDQTIYIENNKLCFKPIETLIENNKEYDKLLKYQEDIFNYNLILIGYHLLDYSQKNLDKFVVEIYDNKDYFTDFNNYPNIKNEYINTSTKCTMSLILEMIIYDKSIKVQHETLFKSNYFDVLIASQLISSNNFNTKYKDINWNENDKLLVTIIVNILKNSVFYSSIQKINYKDDFDFNHMNRLFEVLFNYKYDLSKNIDIGLKNIIKKEYNTYFFTLSSKQIYLTIGHANSNISLNKLYNNYNVNDIQCEIENFANTNNLKLDVYLLSYLNENNDKCILVYFTKLFNSNNKEFSLNFNINHFLEFLRKYYKSDFELNLIISNKFFVLCNIDCDNKYKIIKHLYEYIKENI